MLKEAVDTYLAVRRATGFKLQDDAWYSLQFCPVCQRPRRDACRGADGHDVGRAGTVRIPTRDSSEGGYSLCTL